MQIDEVTTVTNDLVEAWERLMPQLSGSASPPTRGELEQLIASDASVMFVARDPDNGDRIIGSLTLVLYRIPVGLKAWIEDVVVDESLRGQGVGAQLTEAAIARAEEAGARSVNLTSSPDRQAANRLYERLGFSERNTKVYRYKKG